MGRIENEIIRLLRWDNNFIKSKA